MFIAPESNVPPRFLSVLPNEIVLFVADCKDASYSASPPLPSRTKSTTDLFATPSPSATS